MKWSPVGDYHMCRHKPPEKVGSIHLPETVKADTVVALVLASGPECVRAKAGDTVIFGKFAGMQYQDGTEEKVLFLRDEAVVACTRPDTA